MSLAWWPRSYLGGILIVFLLRLSFVQARSPSRSSATPVTGRSSIKTRSHSQVVLYETEEHINGNWKGATPSRWSTFESNESPPPPSLQPPAGYQWEGDWKIITSDARDYLGWNYIWHRNKPPTRRRTWLRSCIHALVVVPPKTPKLFTKKIPLFKFIKEDWNFKGFGLSFYKSLLFKESCGVAFRIPITLNLDTWERRPGLPSITSSIELYYPPTAAVFLSASLNLDYLKWVFENILKIARHVVRTLVYTGLGILINNKPLQLEPPQYNLEVSERISMSVSWRISAKRGYEFRVSYSHSYLPTVLYWHKVLGSKRRLLAENWLRAKTGSLGISTSGPTPDPPHFSCSTLLSLSGFHFRGHQTVERGVEEEISSTATTTTSVRVADMEKVAI